MRNQFPAARDQYAPDEHFLAELMQGFGFPSRGLIHPHDERPALQSISQLRRGRWFNNHAVDSHADSYHMSQRWHSVSPHPSNDERPAIQQPCRWLSISTTSDGAAHPNPVKTHACDGHLWLYLWWSHGRPCDPSDDGTGAAAVLCSYANAWASVCWSAELTDHTGGRQLGSHTPCKAPDTLGAQVPFQGPQLQPGTTSCGAMLRVSLSTFCTGCNSAFRT